MMWNNWWGESANWGGMGWHMANWPGFGSGWGFAFMAIVVWSLVWKGLALWKSARKGQNVWFVVLLVANTAGILDILYLYVFPKKYKSVE